jgi:hypothetical protein
MVRRTTKRKRMQAKLHQIQQQLRERMHDAVPLNRKVAPIGRPSMETLQESCNHGVGFTR